MAFIVIPIGLMICGCIWLAGACFIDNIYIHIVWALFCIAVFISAACETLHEASPLNYRPYFFPPSRPKPEDLPTLQSPSEPSQKAPRKAAPPPKIRFPIQNKASRYICAPVRKGGPAAALVMPIRKMSPWKDIPKGQRNRACREYFAYRLRQPWILDASPELLGMFLFGYFVWVEMCKDKSMTRSFEKAGEPNNLFYEFLDDEYLCSRVFDRFDLIAETLGDRGLASAYIFETEGGLKSLKFITPEALVIDAGTWADPSLKSSSLSDWTSSAAFAGLAAGIGLSLFAGDVDGAELKADLAQLAGGDREITPFMERMGTEADELRQEIIANTPAEPESIDDDADFGFGFGFSSSGAEEGGEYSGGTYVDSNYGDGGSFSSDSYGAGDDFSGDFGGDSFGGWSSGDSGGWGGGGWGGGGDGGGFG